MKSPQYFWRKMKFLKLNKRKSLYQLMAPRTNSQANLSLVIKIHTKGPWQQDVTKVLSKLEGVHTFMLDGEQGSIQVVGNVEPEMLMNVLSKSTRNAEISKAYFTKDGFNQNLFSTDSLSSFCPKCRSWHGQSCNTNPCPNPNYSQPGCYYML